MNAGWLAVPRGWLNSIGEIFGFCARVMGLVYTGRVFQFFGETLRQTALGVALTGDLTAYSGPARSIGYRWFTDPATRQLYAPDDHRFLTRMFASGLREVLTLRGPGSRAAHLADLLLAQSAEFREVWNDHEVGIRPNEVKHFIHPELGALELTCQTLVDPNQSHFLLVYTAIPGSESYEKLQLLSVIGTQALR